MLSLALLGVMLVLNKTGKQEPLQKRPQPVLPEQIEIRDLSLQARYNDLIEQDKMSCG